MRYVAILLLALFTASGAARAQNANVQGLQIISYGIYTADVVSTQPNHKELNNVRLAVSTQTVPAQLGVLFGFRYKITGIPAGAPVRVREVTFYPPGGAHPPGKDVSAGVQVDLAVPIDVVRGKYYSFDEPWELIPGTWTFEVWSGDRKLVEQSFTVVAQ